MTSKAELARGAQALRVRIGNTRRLARQAKSLALEPLGGARLPAFSSGSHVEVRAAAREPLGAAPFSLTASPRAESYQIVVAHDPAEGMLSEWLYEEAEPGDELYITAPRCGLPLHAHAERHCLIAGGSGITAFLSHLYVLASERYAYELHYAVRDRGECIHHDVLTAYNPQHVRIYVSSAGRRLQVDQILQAQSNGTHVYVCGPPRLIQSVVDTAAHCGFPCPHIHWDHYGWVPQLPGCAGIGLDVASA